ncbi:tetratricopeptide repeat protein [Nocardia sp. R16R-3T]
MTLDTVTARYDIADWRGRMGQLERTIADFERLVIDHIRILGSDHPWTLRARNSLAYWCSERGSAVAEMLARFGVFGPVQLSSDGVALRRSVG